MAVRSSKTETIMGDIRLHDLRELVLRTEAAPSETHVDIHEGSFTNHPTDHDEDKISVTWNE